MSGAQTTNEGAAAIAANGRVDRNVRGWRLKMDWFGFWIFLAVFVACDHWIFAQGYDSFFQIHKTEAEKELQRLKIEELRRKVEASNA